MLSRSLPEEINAITIEAMDEHQVPGVAVGVLHDGIVYAGGYGVTNVIHPLPVTPETLFQIGSTSKTFTATAIMQLEEAGLISLQCRVRDYLPDFALESEDDADRVTVLDLLTHHGGWVGDVFENTGRGNDALAKVVATMSTLPQIVPVGTAFSYSNAGFYVLGRIVEVVSGLGFERFIRERILKPLGLDMTFYFPEETIVHGVAAGHIRTTEGPAIASPWATPRSIAPGGGLTSNAYDQLRWAAFHIDGDERVVAQESLARMQEVHRPAGSVAPWIGLSWMLNDIGGARFAAHGGATNGQLSAFEFCAERRYACTVLTNSDSGRAVRPLITEACRKTFLGISSPRAEETRSVQPSPDLAGTYSMRLAAIEVAIVGSHVEISEKPRRLDGRLEPLSPPPVRLTMSGPDNGLITEGSRRGETVEFLRDSEGNVAFIRFDGRLAGRVG